MAKITFVENQITIDAKDGAELLDIYRKNQNLPMRFGCTKGGCGACSLEVHQGLGHLTKKSPLECSTLERKGLNGAKYRLGCQLAVNGDVCLKFIDEPQ